MARTSRRTPRTQGERSAKGGVRLWQLRQGSGSAVSGLGRRAGQRSAPTRTLVGKKILKKQKRKSKNEGRVRRHSAGVGNPFHGAFSFGLFNDLPLSFALLSSIAGVAYLCASLTPTRCPPARKLERGSAQTRVLMPRAAGSLRVPHSHVAAH